MNEEPKQDRRDLTVSRIDRQNILNNPYALREIEKAAGITGIPFEGRTVVLKEQVACFFEVALRTVENYISRYREELYRNGYEIVKGARLKRLKSSIAQLDVPEICFGNIHMTPQLGVFDLRAFLNICGGGNFWLKDLVQQSDLELSTTRKNL